MLAAGVVLERLGDALGTSGGISFSDIVRCFRRVLQVNANDGEFDGWDIDSGCWERNPSLASALLGVHLPSKLFKIADSCLIIS